MKLLLCPKCSDVFKLDYELRRCKCGLVCGKYIDHLNAVVNGEGASMAIDNNSIIAPMYAEKYKHKVDIKAWLRPHEGELNPNTKIDRELGKEGG